MKGFSSLIAITAALLFNQASAQGHESPLNPCLKELINSSYHSSVIGLKNCRLSNNDMSFVANYVLQNKFQTVSFYLDKNNIGSRGIELLLNQLKEVNINTISLDDNHVGPKGAAEIATVHGLRSLFINNNNIRTEGALALAQISSLRELQINNNQVGAEAITAIAKNLPLQMLHIAESTLDKESIASLAMNKSIQKLDLSYTNISGTDLETLLDLPGLIWLKLDGLNMGEKEVKAISDVNTLIYLSVANNNIDANSIEELGLDNLYRLNELNISNNPIGDQGIISFMNHSAQTLSYHFELIADECNITNNGALALARQIKSHPNILSSLSVNYNHIGTTGKAALQQSLAKLSINHNDGLEVRKT